MITFHNEKQGRLLHLGQFRIYNIEVNQGAHSNIVENVLGRLTKTTNEECLHFLMVA